MKAKKIAPLLALGVAAYFLIGCGTKIPAGAAPVKNFNTQKYLGKWYEIARMSEFFERGLAKTSAEYSLNADKTIKVINRGYSTEKNRWKEAEGTAKFVKDENTASLKVSFFKPFWAGYNVIAIEGDYEYALVLGDSLRHLWILSRTQEIPDKVKEDFLKKAREIGYDTSKLIWVKQN